MANFSDASALISGTSLVGMVHATFDQLVSAFGAPHHEGSGLDRVTAEWCIRSRAGVMTIYDRSTWAGIERSSDAFWWDIGAQADQHTDKSLHPVVVLVHELTGCPVKDSRAWCHRPDGQMPSMRLK